MENNKLDKRTKWSYCIGATGRDMAYALISMFLLTYIQYTMKLTVAQYAVISAIMVVCLLWDAINDPMMGIIIENSHLKAGKFKPWIFIGVILNSLIIICLFTVRPEGWGFVAFFGVGYLLWGMTYTMNDIAYWGMLPSLTSDPGERNWLVTVQGIFICIGQFSVAGLLPDMVAGNAIMAYRTAAIVIAFCFIGFQLLTVFGVKERKRPEKKRTLSLKDMFHIFLRNDQLIVIGIACLLFQIGNGLLIMIGMNFFYFEFGYSVGGSLVFWFTIMYGLGTLISEASFAWLSSKFTRNQIITAATIITVIGYMLFMSVGYILPKSVVLLNIIGFLIFFSQGAFNMTMIVMLNNTIEYDEVRFHERHDSIISAVRSFATKLASAVDQAVVALILIISNIYAISQKISGLEIKAGTGELTSENVIVQADKFIQTADTQEDPIKDGENWYGYCGNNVVNYSDWAGLASSNTRYVATDNVYMRSGAGTSYNVLATLQYNTAVTYLNEKKNNNNYNWAKVQYEGKTGWIADKYLKTSKRPSISATIDSVAQKFGFEYSYGGQYFYSSEYGWQRTFGYMDLFDKYMNIVPGININFLSCIFQYNNKTWRVECWKGEYGPTAGGEVGLYVLDGTMSLSQYFQKMRCDGAVFTGTEAFDRLFSMIKNTEPLSKNVAWYRAAYSSEYIGMSIAFREVVQKKNGGDSYTTNAFASRSSSGHWWLTVFKLNSAKKENIIMDVTLTFPNSTMRSAYDEKLYWKSKYGGYKIMNRKSNNKVESFSWR